MDVLENLLIRMALREGGDMGNRGKLTWATENRIWLFFPLSSLDFLYGVLQGIQVLADGVPDSLQFDSKISMHQDVPHTRNLFPWNVGVAFPDVLRNVFDGFANDFQPAKDGVVDLRIRHEFLH